MWGYGGENDLVGVLCYTQCSMDMLSVGGLRGVAGGYKGISGGGGGVGPRLAWPLQDGYSGRQRGNHMGIISKSGWTCADGEEGWVWGVGGGRMWLSAVLSLPYQSGEEEPVIVSTND